MLCQAHRGGPRAPHHVMVQGLEHGETFRDNTDRDAKFSSNGIEEFDS